MFLKADLMRVAKSLAFLPVAALLTLGAFVAPAAAQTAKVVTTCGSLSPTYTAGQFGYPTIDINGQTCTPTGGGGGGNVNISQINGAAPSLTNPIFVANAEAADSTGTFTNATQTNSVTNSAADGYATALLSINGTFGTASGAFEESDDAGVTWYSIICTRSDGSATETGYSSLTNTNRQWSCPVAGNDSVRVRSTAVASGTVNVRVGISAPTNNSGVVSGSVVASQATAASLNATVVGTGTFAVQATQAGTWNIGSITTLPALAAGSAVIGHVIVDSAPSTAVTGTVTANAGTNLNTSALALDTSVNGLLLAQGSTTAAQKGPLLLGAVTTAAPSYTTAQTSPISLDTAGNVRINCITGCGGAGSVSNASSAVATSSTNTGAVSYLYGFNGTTWDQLQADASKNLKVADASVVAAVTAAAVPVPLPITGSTTTTAQVTITTGGTAQNLFSAAQPTNGFEVCNPNATEDAWGSETTTAVANAGFRVPANGGCYDSPVGSKPSGVVSIIAATTAHKLTVKNW